MKRTNRKIKSVIAGILAVIMIAMMGVLPASATSSAAGVDILFYVPSDWSPDGYGPRIHLWNAGSYTTSWPGTTMTQVGEGIYRYTNFSLNSCDFVINDGNGKQTANLYTNGKVTVKDGDVISRSQHPTQIRFSKPSTWGNDVKIYYYSADSSSTAIYSWPGTAMEKEDVFHYYGKTVYNYEITEFENCRVMFTDGVNQYPEANQPGISVTAGNSYYITTTGAMNSQDYYHTTITSETNQVLVGQEFKIVLDTDNNYARYISDKNNGMQIVDETILSLANGRIVKEYTVKFTTAGTKNIYAYYAYLGSGEYLGKHVTVKVYDNTIYNPENTWGGLSYINNPNSTVTLGQQSTVTCLLQTGDIGCKFITEDGELLNLSTAIGNINSETVLNFTINRRCENMKVYVYTHDYYTPYILNPTGMYFTITVK